MFYRTKAESIRAILKFIGKKTVGYLFQAILAGLFVFLIEISFVFVLQGFLSSIGILANQKLFLPKWYPTDTASSLVILLTFGVLRSISYAAKSHIAYLAQLQFCCDVRELLFIDGLTNKKNLSASFYLSMFSEIVNQAGMVVYNSIHLIIAVIVSIFFAISGVKIAPIEMSVGILTVLILILPFKFLVRKVSVLGENLGTEWHEVSKQMLQGLSHNFFLKIHNLVNGEIRSGTNRINSYKSNYLKYSAIAALSIGYPMFLGGVVLVVIIFASLKTNHSSPIVLLSFIYIFTRFSQSSSEINNLFSAMTFNLPAMKRLYSWYTDLGVNPHQDAKKMVKIEKENIEISATNAAFSYGKKLIFKGVSFKITQSDMLVIKGETGSGKSTILSILLGILHLTDGEIIINGQNINDHHLDLSAVLGYVGPEPFLVPGSIKENLLFGHPAPEIVTDEELWNALTTVELDALVRGFSQQLDCLLNEKADLSTGQKQRLSFARAIVRKPLLLILDEATANLDEFTENRILEQLKPLLKKCTTVVVTHKTTFDKYATCEIRL